MDRLPRRLGGTKIYDMKLIGRNPNFIAIFDAARQEYTVYYRGRRIVGNKHKYSDIRSYLD